MPKYRKKPVVIEAFKIGNDELPDWFKDELFESANPKFAYVIPTEEGDMLASHGDYIIKGVKGELYPCKPDIFEATYDPV